jgi:ribosomal protein L29
LQEKNKNLKRRVSYDIIPPSMKTLHAKEIREKTPEERIVFLSEKRNDLRVLLFGKGGRNTKHIRSIKKDIARIHTIDTEKQTEMK